ncbi:MAG: hypothetical protein UY17_C0033G0010 [Candidatus Beckwithbacteria bacterium GW2011_GWC2_47_9]|uniref:Uncharacterized protein n=1 Tax=Candidatus Beckwithbacteria bacterium GW2011_GWC2_47_9 TaxID=1618373 RepID=A0A0G1TYS6_9BACT|nr:MAG: hypothetical protein UY17_C0033G0010 [Candidatus Beckwithbacteria bacterium GW2011_GWC2_47_9]
MIRIIELFLMTNIGVIIRRQINAQNFQVFLRVIFQKHFLTGLDFNQIAFFNRSVFK